MKSIFLIIASIVCANYNCQAQSEKVEDFIPDGYVLFEKKFGDLNKDKQEDCLLIIKGTNKDKVVLNEYGEMVDRNRRGIIILFKNKNGYQKATENINCFSSENEDGGIYFPPELFIGVERGNLSIHYGHGRYGFWRYTFRYQQSDFKLIGYDEQNGGAVIKSELSLNFLTKKKLVKENTNENAIGGDEVFKESWSKIEINRLLSLSEIKDFDDVDMAY
jgi:hypothetical protein